MWFPLSLFTIIAWAGSDFFSKKGTRPSDRYSHLRLVIVVGTVMLLHAVIFIIVTGFEYEPVSIIKYLPVSFMYILSMTCGYAGLRYIELSVSSPICNSSGAVSCLLCFFFLKQTMAGLQAAGVVIICLGILALSVLERRYMKLEAGETEEAQRKYRVGVIAICLPIIYCIVDGLGTFMDAYWLEHILDEEQANISYEFTFALCALASYLYLRLRRREKFSFTRERTFGAAAICETAGQFTYIYALGDNAIAAAPLIASYSVFSVLLSRIFLKEKLRAPQYAVILTVIAGIVILGVFDA